MVNRLDFRSVLVTMVLLGVMGGIDGCSRTDEDHAASPTSETCRWPTAADGPEASMLGCFPRTPAQICGAGPCRPICETGAYQLSCFGDGAANGTMPSPDSSLGCRVLPYPTPPGTLFYCCPCSGSDKEM
jgi:hypothetical protein